MRTKTITLYQFNELSEEAKENALDNLRIINVGHDWWNDEYEDAANIGLKITSFDLDRNKHAKGHFIEDATCCARKILREHGDMCDTYKLAKAFLTDYDKLVEKHSDGISLNVVAEDNEQEFDDLAFDLEREFLEDLLEEYASILQRECDYQQSEKAIIETIQCNEWEFTADGKPY